MNNKEIKEALKTARKQEAIYYRLYHNSEGISYADKQILGDKKGQQFDLTEKYKGMLLENCITDTTTASKDKEMLFDAHCAIGEGVVYFHDLGHGESEWIFEEYLLTQITERVIKKYGIPVIDGDASSDYDVFLKTKIDLKAMYQLLDDKIKE